MQFFNEKDQGTQTIIGSLQEQKSLLEEEKAENKRLFENVEITTSPDEHEINIESDKKLDKEHINDDASIRHSSIEESSQSGDVE